MTSEQKLDIVYKKLVHARSRTKDGASHFEEPFVSPRQAVSNLVYVNSGKIPQVAPNDDVIYNGVTTLKYVKDDTSRATSSDGKSFKLSFGKLIPASYGSGYGIKLKTREGRIIENSDFPFFIDYEAGIITFEDSAPYDVSLDSPLVADYHCYTGRTLGAIQTFSRIGQRGEAGPTGPKGPKDATTMIYRGSTDFSVPGTQYFTNDVITYTVNGNSYVCLHDTDESPDDVPYFWQILSPSGDTGYMPSRVLFVNDSTLVPTGDFFVSGGTHYTGLQDAIDACESGVWTTILVNSISNEAPLGDSFVVEDGKQINLIFKKYASVFDDSPSSKDFSFSITDSHVIFENARIGGGKVYSKYDTANTISVNASDGDASATFINCRINSDRIIAQASGDYDAKLHFNRSHVNALSVISNSVVRFDACLAFCSVTIDASQSADTGKTHELTVRNTKFFNRTSDGRFATEPKDIVILARRDDLDSFYVQFFNALLPGVFVKIVPETLNISYDAFKLLADNSIFFEVRLDSSSTNQFGSLTVVGGNNLHFDDVSLDHYMSFRDIKTPDIIQSQEFSKRGVNWDSAVSATAQPIESYFTIANQWNMLSL